MIGMEVCTPPSAVFRCRIEPVLGIVVRKAINSLIIAHLLDVDVHFWT